MQNEMKVESGTSNASMALEAGLDYIITHFEGQIWPRTISTKATENRQVVVTSREEALARFAQANLLDCRISAYPMPSTMSSFVGINLDIAPSIVMIDIDRETFKTQRAFEVALTKTLRKIFETIISGPTVIWSGSGYHIYLAIDAIVLESEDIFNNGRFGSNPSQKFLRFAEWFLSNGKCDPQHNKTVSIRNCMLRIPGSINSKNGQIVRIIQNWDGSKPNIRSLLGSFHAWLADQQIKEMEQLQKYNVRLYSQNNNNNNNSTIYWIEKLLQTPIYDNRKLAVSLVLAPYVINIRQLEHNAALEVIMDWLQKCNDLRRLDSRDFNYRIKKALENAAKTGYLPMRFNTLKEKYSDTKLYAAVSEAWKGTSTIIT
jgi:hypothetical protein